MLRSTPDNVNLRVSSVNSVILQGYVIFKIIDSIVLYVFRIRHIYKVNEILL